MRTRREVIDFCLSLKGTYEDYPFNDFNWTVMRCEKNKRMFAAIFERQGKIWINVKCEPGLAEFWRNTYEAVIPAYHMNKKHWNSIITEGSVPENEIKNMIRDSFEIVNRK